MLLFILLRPAAYFPADRLEKKAMTKITIDPRMNTAPMTAYKPGIPKISHGSGSGSIGGGAGQDSVQSTHAQVRLDPGGGSEQW